MRVRIFVVLAVTMLVAGSLSANIVSFKATGTYNGKALTIDRTGDGFFTEAFVQKDSVGKVFNLAFNFGNNLGDDKFRWDTQFMAPEGTELVPATYANPSRSAADRKGLPFMILTGGGTDAFGCSDNDPTIGRTFTLSQLTSVADNSVTQFLLTFTEKCGTNSLTGSIAFGTTALPGGGDDGGGGTTTTPPAPFQIQFPSDFDVEPVVLTNSGSRTIPFKIAVDTTTFNSDIHLAVETDALDHEDFHASVTPSTIAAPGAGNANLTITTGPLTFPRIYQVALIATSGDQTFSRTFLVHVSCDPPFILGTSQPKSIVAANGTQVTLEVKPSGSGPFFYQWYKGIPGMTRNPVLAANESKLIFTTRETAIYWVRVSNACGTVNSNAATVTTTGSLSGPARRRSGG